MGVERAFFPTGATTAPKYKLLQPQPPINYPVTSTTSTLSSRQPFKHDDHQDEHRIFSLTSVEPQAALPAYILSPRSEVMVTPMKGVEDGYEGVGGAGRRSQSLSARPISLRPTIDTNSLETRNRRTKRSNTISASNSTQINSSSPRAHPTNNNNNIILRSIYKINSHNLEQSTSVGTPRPIPRIRSTTLRSPVVGPTNEHVGPTSDLSHDLNLEEADEFDLLDVVDPAVQAASTLTHLQNSLFLPRYFNRFGTPVIELERPPSGPDTTITDSQHPQETADEPRAPITTSPNEARIDHPTSSPVSTRDLDHHLITLYNQANPISSGRETGMNHTYLNSPKADDRRWYSAISRHELRRVWDGILAFISTPIGVLFVIYGLLVVFWGAALVLILLRWIKIEPDRNYRIWVEICSQILNGLFTITGIGLFPSRLIDARHIGIIAYYARTIWKRKGKKNLDDPNDLIPEIKNLEEGRISATYNQSEEDLILDLDEIDKLRDSQTKLCKSQTWYRPHSSTTHHAFPIGWAIFIISLNIGNSVFQAGLCGVMWGLTYSKRPAWTTATLMSASFSCGLASAILIWRVGASTRKSKNILKKMKGMMRLSNIEEEAEPTEEEGTERVEEGKKSEEKEITDKLSCLNEENESIELVESPKETGKSSNSKNEDDEECGDEYSIDNHLDSSKLRLVASSS